MHNRYCFLGNTSPESVVRHYLSLHTNILSITDDRIVPKLVRPSHVRDAKVQDDSVMHNAATNIILGSYRNQLMHVFVRVAMVALSVNGCLQETMSMGEHTWGSSLEACSSLILSECHIPVCFFCRKIVLSVLLLGENHVPRFCVPAWSH